MGSLKSKYLSEPKSSSKLDELSFKIAVMLNYNAQESFCII